MLSTEDNSTAIYSTDDSALQSTEVSPQLSTEDNSYLLKIVLVLYPLEILDTDFENWSLKGSFVIRTYYFNTANGGTSHFNRYTHYTYVHMFSKILT